MRVGDEVLVTEHGNEVTLMVNDETSDALDD